MALRTLTNRHDIESGRGNLRQCGDIRTGREILVDPFVQVEVRMRDRVDVPGRVPGWATREGVRNVDKSVLYYESEQT